MSKFIPDSGTYFYVSCKPIEQHALVTNSEGLPVLTKVPLEDRSWKDYIFKCTARDEHAVYGSSVVGMTGVNQLFKIEYYSFTPVGPEMTRIFEQI